MASRIPCIQCGAEILPETHTRTGGVCMACKQGIRKSLDNSKKYYQKQKTYDPFDELWKSLVHRVYKSEKGFDKLTPDEKLYWSVSTLVGEVYNGGIHQFFSNSSGNLFSDVAVGLKTLEADCELPFCSARPQFYLGKSNHQKTGKNGGILCENFQKMTLQIPMSGAQN